MITRHTGSRDRRRGRAARFAVRLGLAAILGLVARGAHAQLLDQYIPVDLPGLDTGQGVTVTSRQHPEYDPLHIRVGDIVVSPTVSEQAGYDDNVTGAPHGRGSTLLDTSGALGVALDGSRGSAVATLSFDNQVYPELPRETQTSWGTSIGGSRTLGMDTIGLQFTHQDNSQNGRELDEPLLDKPIQYRVEDARLFYNLQLSQLSIEPVLEFSYLDYSNGTVQGVPYLQAFRDRTVISPSVTLRYELAPQRDFVFVVRDSSASYTREISAGRDFNDVSVLGGLEYGDGVWRLLLLGGYETRSFSGAMFKTIAAPVAQADLIWTPTELTTLTATASRHIQDSSDETITAFTESDFKLSVDHEYLRNVQLHAYAGLDLASYSQGGGQTKLYIAGTSATWLVNRLARISATYDFTDRNSGGAVTQAAAPVSVTTGLFGPDYMENRYLLQFTVDF